MRWEDQQTVRKGNIGERLVDEYLENQKGFVVYRPVTDGAHPFDRLCASRDKREICVAETKSKGHRIHYPDTGFNTSHLSDYMHIMMRYSMDVYVYWVDDVVGQIYGGELAQHLMKPRQVFHNGRLLEYPLTHGAQVYFPLEAMEIIADIPAEDLKELRSLTTGQNARPPQETLF